MSNAAFRSRPNPWIALGGLAVLVALAIGLLSSGATNVEAQQYGPPEPPGIGDVSVKPLAPQRGKGFKVTFKSGGQVSYRIYVIDKIDNRFILDRGSANGAKTTKVIGKQLKAGQYKLYTGSKSIAGEVQSNGNPVYYDREQQDLVIRR
ncbi:MAG TPA: hypothetical protein VF549_11330 [Solirubrobacteraceae bacterium]|jgi:hypothetical protein